jgi:hypothetical protein
LEHGLHNIIFLQHKIYSFFGDAGLSSVALGIFGQIMLQAL